MPTAQPAQVEICYCASADITPATPAELASLLDADEQQRYQRMRAPVAARFLQGRRMVRQLLAEQLQCKLGSLLFSYSENGKPQLACGAPWHFSISHCDTAVVVAIGTVELGVDVEEINRQRGKLAPPWQKAEQFMHSHNAAQVTKCTLEKDKAHCFTLLWTLMESQVKLADSSIFRASKHLAIELGSGTAVLAEPARDCVGACHWWAFKGLEGDLFSLATAEPAVHLKCSQWQGNCQRPRHAFERLLAPVAALAGEQ